MRSNEEVGKFLTDKTRIIPNMHLTIVCIGSGGASACRYMCSVAQGFTCVKNTPLKATIDNEVRTNDSWRARGDNCDGFGENNFEKHKECIERGSGEEKAT